VSRTGTDFPASQAQILVLPSLRWAYYEQETPSSFFPTIRSTQEAKTITTDKLRTRTSFQRFLNKTPRSPFKKLIVSTPNLLQGLRTMSLMKSVPKGLNPQECKRTKLRKPLPVPYIPEKDKVQEEVVKLQNL
jgi:hypothetical protein